MVNVIYTISMFIAVIGMCSGSAIPMWEFLSRDEKMSHLYSMFAKDVSKYCKTTTASPAECKRDLLAFGVNKLEKMTETHLDAMDPYQRSANDIIWDSIMDGHPTMSTKKSSTTPAPIREPSGQYEHNPLFDNDNDFSDKSTSNFASDMDYSYSAFPTGPADSVYNEPSNQLSSATALDLQYEVPSVLSPRDNYLTGPMVIRVRPDGSPVEEDRFKPLPRDDDRAAMTLGKARMPSFHQLAETLQAPAPQAQKSYTNYRTINRRHF